MNTFLAREVALRIVLTLIIVVIPVFLTVKPLIIKATKSLPDMKTSLEKITAGLSEKYAKQKKLRQALQQAKNEREAIALKKLERKEEERILQEKEAEAQVKHEQQILTDATKLKETQEQLETIHEESATSPDNKTESANDKDHEDEKSVKDLDNTQEVVEYEKETTISGWSWTRTLIHSNDIDQQKFQKQLESIKYAALTYKERWKDDKYEKKLIEWLSMEQDNQEFMGMLADHYFGTENYVKALTLLKKIITVQTDNHKAIRQIGRIYQTQKKPDAAQLLVEKALEKKPDHPKYLISLVEIYYDKDEKRSALDIMQRLRKIRPTNIDYLLTVATLHEELNEPTFAKNYYMKILELSPSNEHAKEWLKQL